MPPDITIDVPRVVRPIRWRPAEGADLIEIFDERLGKFTPYYPWTRDVLEGLEQHRPFTEQVDRLVDAHTGKLPRAQAEHMLRKFLFSFANAGHLDLGYAPAPQAFTERYEVVQELGRGGVGIAWLCLDRESGERVVVKHAWGFFTDTANADAHVRRESAALGEIGGHPGVIARKSAFDENGLHHLVRAYGEGEPLLRRTWDASSLATLSVALADIVAHVHERGYLLLDLHPQNFLLAPGAAQPVLIDVGLALRHAGGSVSLRPTGTRGFQPPEMLKERVVDTRSDVWIFGRLLFALATGILPRKDWSHEEFLRRIDPYPIAAPIRELCAPAPGDRPSMREAQALLRDHSAATRLVTT